MSIISSTSSSTSSTATLSQRLGAAIGASILGACLVYFAGFSHIEAVHNAAHDTRHSAGVPVPLRPCRHDQAYCANRRFQWAAGRPVVDLAAKFLGRPADHAGGNL
jgi:cobalt transporter subunit CbtB